MSRNYGGPKLPINLLSQVSSGRIGKRKQISRKEQRKADRTGKKQLKAGRSALEGPVPSRRERHVESQQTTVKKSAPTKSPKRAQREPTSEEVSDDEDIEEVDVGQEEIEEDDDDSVASSGSFGSFTVSRAHARSTLHQDDDEIAALERKLGIKGKKSKAIDDDELDWLVSGGLSSEDEDGLGLTKSKRKRPEDEDWLQSKRRKAEKKHTEPVKHDESDDVFEELESGEDSTSGGMGNPFSEDELSEGDFGDFDEDAMDGDDSTEEIRQPRVKKERENPYVAPVSESATKYVPPSLRKPASSDEELLKQLRRQLQGQLNRLSEANLVSILGAIQEIYTKNARQHVTSVLVELFRDLICDPAVLTETFLILHAGFAAALYRTIGVDFGAQLLESIVDSFDKHHAEKAEGKQTLNLLAFLSNLYTLQAIGSEIIFDYIRMLLENFSEANTELLLRVIRTSGQQLRQDDPTSLKDIVLLLQRSVAALGGEEKVSVRTKYMIETIHDLKNNKMKTGVKASALSAEHMQRMKKTLGSVKTAKTTEPMRITLADIRESDKKGKWWLVGASYKDPAKMATSQPVDPISIQAKSRPDPQIASPEDENEIDLEALARSQGMNSPVRIAIFVCIAGAEDPHHAFLRIQKLNLKHKQQIENIPRVLLHCIAAETTYNHYYSIIATKFCTEHRMRKAWQFALYDIFRRMGGTADENRSDDEDNDQEDVSVRKIYNIANLYATLISETLLRISILKPLTFTPATLSAKTKIFAEVLITSIFISLRKMKSVGKKGLGKAVEEIFAAAHTVEGMAKGLIWFLEEVVVESKMPEKKVEVKAVERGVEFAVDVLRDERKAVAAMKRGFEDDDGGNNSE